MPWVRRVSEFSHVCENCDDHIRPGVVFYRMLTGERYCPDCPPEEESCQ